LADRVIQRGNNSQMHAAIPIHRLGKAFDILLWRHHWIVRRAESQIQKKRLPLPLTPNEGLGLTAQQLGFIIRVLEYLGVLSPQVVKQRLPAQRVVAMRRVINPAGVESEK